MKICFRDKHMYYASDNNRELIIVLEQYALFIGLRHAKRYLRAYVDREGPDQPLHPCSLIKAITL